MNLARILFVCSLITATSCINRGSVKLEDGVSLELAQSRATNISNITYNLKLNIPDDASKPIVGSVSINLELKSTKDELVLDFAAKPENVKSVTCNGKAVNANVEKEHIVISPKYLKGASNHIEVEFTAGDKSLNRKKDYLYSLFVPDNARYAFPCFDQPDLKAKFTLTMDIPRDWTAVSSGPDDSVQEVKGKKRVSFQQSDIISTYQFAFVAGKFKCETKEIDGRLYRLFHREEDQKKLDQNVDSIFEIAHHSVVWMESYTGILFPFKKYDLIAIPSFQFGGMEHVGAIYYLDSKLFLNENPTLQEKLYRVELIGHETAHLWFGDMVTMKWFDDVWLKEVFAGFFSDKIAESMFPKIDHKLQFLLNHAPSAYSEDRTLGNNAIRQPLENLNQAGSLYGNIVYDKSPMAIRMLENLMGKNELKLSLQEFLKKFELSNATWFDLLDFLAKRSHFDVKKWSKCWIENAGFPIYTYKYETASDYISQFSINQVSEVNNGLVYLQNVKFRVIASEPKDTIISLKSLSNNVPAFKGVKDLKAVIPNIDGMAYGAFLLDDLTKKWLQQNFFTLSQPLERGSVLIMLFENMLQDNLEKGDMLALINEVIRKESNEQLINLALSYTQYLSIYGIEKDADLEPIEANLWNRLATTESKQLKIQFLRTFSKVVRSYKASEKLYDLWLKEVKSSNSWISENDLQSISLELSIRFPDRFTSISTLMKAKLTNEDKLAKYSFVLNAVNPDANARDKFFESLLKVENRKNEVWVSEALTYLNHPMRANESAKYLKKGLKKLAEIKATGDIFFPKKWLSSLVYGHTSADDYKVVQEYRSANEKKIDSNLMLKVLQATDNLRRCNSK